MIYLVTGNPNLVSNKLYQVISIERSLELLTPLTEIGVDTETSGIKVHTKELLLVQLGNYDFQVVIDCKTIDITKYNELFKQNKL